MGGILDETRSPLEDDATVSVDVVLVRTHSPGNLGSAARACKAFGARLLLLDPRAEATHEDARAFASGAEDLLASAPRLAGWEEAEEGADAVLALTSLRGRNTRGLPPAWTWAAARRTAGAGRLVLAFGPERSGLTTEEVRRAAGRLAIPTGPGFPVLNLAQAVAAALALLAAGRAVRIGASGPEDAGGFGRKAVTDAGEVADARSLRRLRDELAAALLSSGYLGRADDAVLPELVSPLLRARLTTREAELWTGALRKLARRVRGA